MSFIIKKSLDIDSLYNPVAYWLLEESSGNRLDITNNGWTLQEGSSVPNTTGKLGFAAEFNNSNNTSYLENTNLSLGDTFSISCWIKLYNVGPTQCFWGTGGNGGDLISFYSEPNFTLYNDRSSDIDTGFSPQPNIWYHAVSIVTPTEMKLYINGNLAGSLSQNISNSWTGFALSDFKILGGHNFQIDGAIDEVGIWNFNLSETQIKNLYNILTNILINRLIVKKIVNL